MSPRTVDLLLTGALVLGVSLVELLLVHDAELEQLARRVRALEPEEVSTGADGA